jgi:hypothetical protein
MVKHIFAINRNCVHRGVPTGTTPEDSSQVIVEATNMINVTENISHSTEHHLASTTFVL